MATQTEFNYDEFDGFTAALASLFSLHLDTALTFVGTAHKAMDRDRVSAASQRRGEKASECLVRRMEHAGVTPEGRYVGTYWELVDQLEGSIGEASVYADDESDADTDVIAAPRRDPNKGSSRNARNEARPERKLTAASVEQSFETLRMIARLLDEDEVEMLVQALDEEGVVLPDALAFPRRLALLHRDLKDNLEDADRIGQQIWGCLKDLGLNNPEGREAGRAKRRAAREAAEEREQRERAAAAKAERERKAQEAREAADRAAAGNGMPEDPGPEPTKGVRETQKAFKARVEEWQAKKDAFDASQKA